MQEQERFLHQMQVRVLLGIHHNNALPTHVAVAHQNVVFKSLPLFSFLFENQAY